MTTNAAASLPPPATLVQIRAVIFDCDGTLVDSEIIGMDVLYELACVHGLDATREQAHLNFRGMRMADCIAWIESRLPAQPAAFAADFTKQVRAMQEIRFREQLDPLPGAHDLLSRLPIPFCVATNGPREKVELSLSLTGLRPWFGDRIFSAYDLGLFKPDPGLFLIAAEALGVAPAHCAVVEDSLPGILAGLAAGMRVFALHDAGALPREIAERVTCIGSLTELGRHLLKPAPPA
jgi:HAD superfamily hydrolase (TIGR01509 family)